MAHSGRLANEGIGHSAGLAMPSVTLLSFRRPEHASRYERGADGTSRVVGAPSRITKSVHYNLHTYDLTLELGAKAPA